MPEARAEKEDEGQGEVSGGPPGPALRRGSQGSPLHAMPPSAETSLGDPRTVAGLPVERGGIARGPPPPPREAADLPSAPLTDAMTTLVGPLPSAPRDDAFQTRHSCL